MRVLCAVMLVASVAGSNAFAAKKKYKAPYGMAGCGISYLMPKDSVPLQIIGATTNQTSLNQTSSILSGTSGCTSGRQRIAQETKVFIDSNFMTLNREAAQGGGETLVAFADLLGCEPVNFTEQSKVHVHQIYREQSSESVMDEYRTLLDGQCTRVI